MSTQRVCDLDATIINPQTDLFYTVTDARSGRARDICIYCARSLGMATVWAASTALPQGAVIRPTAGLGRYVFIANNAGTTGATEPTWPNNRGLAGTLFTGTGDITWLVQQAPSQAAVVTVAQPGATKFTTTLYGWLSGTNEPVT